MFGLPDLSGGGEGVATNYGIVGGDVPPSPGEHYNTIEDLNKATSSFDAQVLHALTLSWVPWWAWAAGGILTVLILLHELNPTLELLHDVVKSK